MFTRSFAGSRFVYDLVDLGGGVVAGPVISSTLFEVVAGNDEWSVTTNSPSDGNYVIARVISGAAAPLPDGNGGWTGIFGYSTTVPVGAADAETVIPEGGTTGVAYDLYLYQRSAGGQDSNVISITYTAQNPQLTDDFEVADRSLIGYVGASGGAFEDAGSDANADPRIVSGEISNDSTDSNVSTAYVRRADTASYTDCSVVMNIRMDNAVGDSPNVRPVARMTDSANRYEVVYAITAGEWRLRSYLGGVLQPNIGVWSDTFANGETREVELRCEGTTISMIIDGVVRATDTDTDHASGYAGVRAYSGARGSSPITSGHVGLDLTISDLSARGILLKNNASVSQPAPGTLDIQAGITPLMGWSSARAAPESVGFHVAPTGTDLPPTVDYGDGGVFDPAIHFIEWIWDFGDATEQFKYVENLAYHLNNTNVARGPMVQHTYKNPGTYTVTCTARNPVTGATSTPETYEIVVVATQDKFLPSRTFFVDPTGLNVNMPAGATPYTDLVTALLAAYGTNEVQRIMLEWGTDVELPVQAPNAMDGTGSLMISPPDTGSGARPIIRHQDEAAPGASVSGAFFALDGMGGTFQVYGIDFIGPYDATDESGTKDCDCISSGANVRLVSIHDCTFTGFQDAIKSSSGNWSNQRFFVNDCLITNWRNFGIGLFSDLGSNTMYKAIVGCRITQHVDAQAGTGSKASANTHGPIRIGESDFIVIMLCDLFTNCGWTGLGEGFMAFQPCIRLNTEPRIEQTGYANIYGNTCEGGNIIMELGPSTDGFATYPTNFVIHFNFLMGDHQTKSVFTFAAGGASLWNNHFVRPNVALAAGGGNPGNDDPGKRGGFVMWLKAGGRTTAASNSPIFVFLNTFINYLADATTFVTTESARPDSARYSGTANGGSPGLLDFRVSNCLFYQPDVATPVTGDEPFVLEDVLGSDGVNPIRPRGKGYRPSGTGVLDATVATPDVVSKMHKPTGVSAALGSASGSTLAYDDILGTVRTTPQDRGALAA